MLDRNVIRIGRSLQDECSDVRALMHRYRNVPVSLADACLVRMSDLYEGSAVLALDSRFRIYRCHGNRVIPVLMPK